MTYHGPSTHSGGGGLSRVDVSDDNDVNVDLIFTHFCVVFALMLFRETLEGRKKEASGGAS